MSLKPAYKFFFVILHMFYSLLYFVYDHCYYLRRRFGASSHAASISYVNREARKFNKIPTHLTLLLGQEKHSINDLTNIILWSMAAGISFVSIYDCKGHLKKRESDFQSSVRSKIKDGHNVIWHDGPNPTKNGYSGLKIHVKILTEQDGRADIVKTAKHLASAPKRRNINIDQLDQCLRKQFEFPDPDMGVYCGRYFSLYAYPPWQMRVTEFLNLRSHWNITARCFVELLSKYQKREQRLGK